MSAAAPPVVVPPCRCARRRTATARTTCPLEETVSDSLLRLAVRVRTRVVQEDADRGDVPGWVMITLMTAGIVSLIWGVADDALKGLFEDAITKAKTPS